MELYNLLFPLLQGNKKREAILNTQLMDFLIYKYSGDQLLEWFKTNQPSLNFRTPIDVLSNDWLDEDDLPNSILSLIGEM
jgi:Cdc6-like AAA superfamily ATPase